MAIKGDIRKKGIPQLQKHNAELIMRMIKVTELAADLTHLAVMRNATLRA